MKAGAPGGDAKMGGAPEEATRDAGFADDIAIKGGPRSIGAKIAGRAESVAHI